MKRCYWISLIPLFLVCIAAPLYGQSYLWLTNNEVSRFGDHNMMFAHGDTLDGPVHSNDRIAIMQDPVFLDAVTSCAGDFWRGSGYDPQFMGPRPRFHVPRVDITATTQDNIRRSAAAQGHFYSNPGKSYFAHFQGGQVKLAMWNTGTPMDTVTDTWSLPITTRTCLFVNGPLYLYGVVTGQVTIGSAGTMYIIDDVRYADVNNRGRWISPNSAHFNYLGLVSEGDIKIANTRANGRNNSCGRGIEQTNQDSTSVVITAAVVALGESFTFDQQNDPDSGYVSDSSPDERGTIYLLGSLTQARRGYVHRSNNGGTGYRRSLYYDTRLGYHPPPCFSSLRSLEIPDSVVFGNVVIGQTVWDTAIVHDIINLSLGSVYASYPFSALRVPPYSGDTLRIPVRFTPPRTGVFNGMLTIGIEGTIYQIPIRGRGVPAAAALALEVSPNPFNLTTTIRYSVPEGQSGKLAMFDILGRTVREFDLSGDATGEHSLSFNAAELASGVYFIRLQAGADAVSRKVLLLK